MTSRDLSQCVSERLPNFILIGAQKSGTTALYYALKKHPDIFMSENKEPEFFISQHQVPSPALFPLKSRTSDWQQYLRHFDGAAGKRAVGEASVMYLSGYFPEKTALLIRQTLPQVRLIAILRHPAERAYSAYTYFRSRGVEPLPTFQAALAAEPERIEAHTLPDLCYRRNGLYGHNLSKFHQQFSREQILICLYEEWLSSPQLVLQRIFRFLDLDECVVIHPRKHAVTSYVKSRILSSCISQLGILDKYIGNRWRARVQHRISWFNRVVPPPLEPTIKDELTEFYRDDILLLQRLIGRDLSHWLK